MRLARALELTHNFVSTPDSLEGLDSLFDPSLVKQALKQSGVAELHASASHCVLPQCREKRIYPRVIRLKSPKYPIKNKNASQLN